jgi:hypothetical protein
MKTNKGIEDVKIFTKEDVIRIVEKGFGSAEKNLTTKLKAIQTLSDPILAHRLADEMLLTYIGDEDVTEAFNDITKYYE